MIYNAGDIPLDRNPGTLPNMSDALFSLFQPMTFRKISKTQVNFETVEVETGYSTYGVRQPFTPQQLAMKPEGQRAWKWETMHSLPDIELIPDDVIVFNSVRYRVMQKLDWKEYGYIEHHIVQDFKR